METKKRESTYLHTRVYQELGLLPELNAIQLRGHDVEGEEYTFTTPIFSSDKDDNINIILYTINREIIQYDHPSADPSTTSIYNNRIQTYYIKRLKEPKNGAKYLMPKGQGVYPFFPPQIVEKYEKAEKITTLVLTEGHFKAFKGAMHGFDIVGLSSITHYANTKTKSLHTDIVKLIAKCEVKNVVMLYDGDCRNISLNDLKEGEDLTRRPNTFFQSMTKIKELLTDLNVKVYFSHIKSKELEGEPKGLDDLLVAFKGKEEQIKNSFYKLASPDEYFYKLNISIYGRKLQQYFHLRSVDGFYSEWQDLIGRQEFQYYGTKYRLNSKHELEKTVPAEAKMFIRVGDDYYEKVRVPHILGYEPDVQLLRRKKSTIIDDYGRDILKSIPKYKTFINQPSHTNYQQVILDCYNQYCQFTHEPQEGRWDTIYNYIKHIFQEQFEMGLDYIQILYQYPTNILPILCLVSKENKTGKSTFLEFLKLIFGQNVAIVGNDEISTEFNSYTAKRLVVGIDEAFVEKKQIVEKIKKLSTTNSIAMQSKGVDYVETGHFAKYIFVSNNEDNFIYATNEDVRYWVRKIPKLQHDNPTILQDLNDEIPAFLYYLSDRKISKPNSGRGWFASEDLHTQALEKLREHSRPNAEKELRAYIREQFIELIEPKLEFTLADLKERANIKKYEDNYINRILKENMGEERSIKPKRYQIPYWEFDYRANTSEAEIRKEYRQPTNPGRVFTFKIEKYLTAQEIENIGYKTQETQETNKTPF